MYNNVANNKNKTSLIIPLTFWPFSKKTASNKIPREPSQPKWEDTITNPEWKDYIKNRVESQRSWYSKNATSLKDKYMRNRIISVIFSSSIPALAGFGIDWKVSDTVHITSSFIVAVISFIVVILVSLDGINRYGQQWKNYRSTAEFLRRELLLFKHRIGRYSELDDLKAFKNFVSRIEEALEQENAVTLDILIRQEEKSINQNADNVKSPTPTQTPPISSDN